MGNAGLLKRDIKVFNKAVTVWYPRGYTVSFYPELGLCLKGRGLNRNHSVTSVYFKESPEGDLLVKSADERVVIKKFGTDNETTKEWLPLKKPYGLGLELRDDGSNVKVVINIR